ncbi:MAG TPA: 4-hydroxy-3-methylbut-2-enyl diphosphate reductase [Bacteroidetes bacterium]|nr:4-hydroxy-3-methylbut-2-enyl diphosphate reductase [Bacteroidota bacterium]
MKQFEIPTFYRSPIISRVKAVRKESDPRKKDFSPTILDFGPVRFFIARHFGFCYGVENAIEISYKALEDNPGKRLFLLSEMIHNPAVNADLQAQGIRFIMDTKGNEITPWSEVTTDDVVIIPAFGTTVEMQKKLAGLETQTYDTTCPFVMKVWKRADQLGQDQFTVIVHGKHKHEETRATFSHSRQGAPTLVVRDMADTTKLGQIISGELPLAAFYEIFAGKYSPEFDPKKDLQRLGVVNQTTMLASETQAIADYLKQVMVLKYGESSFKNHFADTRDTLCYATNDNQRATFGLLEMNADLAIIVGGYNSSNTSHIVELCEEKYPSYFISSADKINSADTIQHFKYHTQTEITTHHFLPKKSPLDIVLTSGASCPDALVDQVMQKLLSYFPSAKSIDEVMKSL